MAWYEYKLVTNFLICNCKPTSPKHDLCFCGASGYYEKNTALQELSAMLFKNKK